VNRRTALGILLMAALILGGRVVRHRLMVGPDDGWREPGWLASRLTPAPPRAAPQPRLTGPLDVNRSPVDSLVLLPGIGVVLARRIVEARDRGVHFARPQDLCIVRGIGPILSERLAPHLRFGPSRPVSTHKSANCDTAGAKAAKR
jgi:hypothetical protein